MKENNEKKAVTVVSGNFNENNLVLKFDFSVLRPEGAVGKSLIPGTIPNTEKHHDRCLLEVDFSGLTFENEVELVGKAFRVASATGLKERNREDYLAIQGTRVHWLDLWDPSVKKDGIAKKLVKATAAVEFKAAITTANAAKKMGFSRDEVAGLLACPEDVKERILNDLFPEKDGPVVDVVKGPRGKGKPPIKMAGK